MFLTDGGQRAESIASLVAEYVDAAAHSLDIAIYDLRLAPGPAAPLTAAIEAAQARGVAIRLVFNVDHARPVPVPAPPLVDWDLIKGWGLHFRPISGVPDLMHHKYAVRDAGTPGGTVLTGSCNWTNDSWTREENVFLRIASPELADLYTRNFEELWNTREVARSCHQPATWFDLEGPLRARAYFTPARSEKLVHEIAQRIASARRRIRVCSPVITSGPILGTLAEVAGAGNLDMRGVYDATQMKEVHRQWSQRPGSAWKIQAFAAATAAMPFGAKQSTPWQPGSVHDFMHAKIVVADDIVFTGSFNLSHSGEENAENVVELEHAGLADMFAAYIDRVATRYGAPAATVRVPLNSTS